MIASLIRNAFFQDENSIYLLLDYVPGGELYSHLRKRKTFTEQLAKFYTIEIASALDTMHKLSIAYRDIKPEVVQFNSIVWYWFYKSKSFL